VRLEVAALVLGVPLLLPLGWALDARAHEESTVLDLVDVLTPLGERGVLPILAAGHGGTVADLLEVEANNFLMRSLKPGRRMNARHLRLLYQGIIELDPLDPGVVERAAVLMTAVAGRPDWALELLADGKERIPPEHPLRWRLYWEEAGTYLTTLAHTAGQRHGYEARVAQVRRAGEVILAMAELPRTPFPQRFLAFGQALSERQLSEQGLLEHELSRWRDRARGADDEALRRAALERVRETRSALRRLRLQRRVDRFVKQHERPPARLADVAPPEGLEDPLGVGYLLRGRDVLAPGAEARQLERDLVVRLGRWRAEHPGAGPPTLEDLGLDAPDYLEVDLSGPEPVVTAQLPPG